MALRHRAAFSALEREFAHQLTPISHYDAAVSISRALRQDRTKAFQLRSQACPASTEERRRCNGNRAVVNEAFALSNANGGAQDREPALAPHIHPNYFAAYARDPDGRLVEYVCQPPES
jgi:hypothetical protein